MFGKSTFRCISGHLDTMRKKLTRICREAEVDMPISVLTMEEFMGSGFGRCGWLACG